MADKKKTESQKADDLFKTVSAHFPGMQSGQINDATAPAVVEIAAFDPLDMALEWATKKSDITGGQSNYSMIPTKKNLVRFLGKMAENFETLLAKTGDTTQDVLYNINPIVEAFMRTRYPRRMDVPKRITNERYSDPQFRGQYTRSINTVNVSPQDSWNIQGIPVTHDLADSYAHETQHALDWTRAKKGKNIPADPTKAPKYEAGHFDQKYDWNNPNDYQRYWQNPIEKRARDAGYTASGSFSNFDNLLGDAGMVDPQRKLSDLQGFVKEYINLLGKHRPKK